MLLLRDRGIRSGIQITSFSLSICRIRRIVEIVDSYLCDYVCLIISLILYRLDYLTNRFIKNAIRSNDFENRLNAFESPFNALTSAFDFFP